MATGITISNLSKSFGRATVLSDIELEIGPGEFIGLMGPNGAGKSTLIKILGGIHHADRGTIAYDGQPVGSLAECPEVAFIHQDLGLIEDLSVVDNLRLGEPPLRRAGPILNHAKEREAAARALERVGLTCPSTTLIFELSPGEKALVAIARALDRGAKVLFIDEATSTLPPGDARRLIATLKKTAADGATVIMVSHKLSEILDSCRRIVVLIDGRIVSDHDAVGLDRAGLVERLVAHESQAHDPAAPRTAPGEEVMRLEGAAAGRAGPVDLVLRRGEVVGLTGLAGSGLHDVAHLVAGTLEPRAGKVHRAASVTSALVPPHRETQGGFTDLSISENATISALPRWRSLARILRLGRERSDVTDVVTRLAVVPSDITAPYGALSGGNKQKVIFGRALLKGATVYVLCEPTRGVDVATRSEIYDLIRGLRRDGAAVLIVTSDSEDLFAVCDSIGVCVDGRVDDLLPVEESNATQLEAFV
jgi:ribose transport system ATP-binding protein